MIELPDGLDLNFKETQKQLGIVKASSSVLTEHSTYQHIYKILQENDRLQFITRYKWYMTPQEILDSTIENMLYFEGHLMFFYLKETDEFYFLPPNFIENQGQLMNPMGEFFWAYPRAFRGIQELRKDSPAAKKSKQDYYLQTLIRKVCHHIPYVHTEEEALSYMQDACVILHDTTPANGEYPVPRARAVKPLLDLLTQAYIQLDSAILNSSGFQLFNVRPEDLESVTDTLRKVNSERRRGAIWGTTTTSLEPPVVLQNGSNTASMLEMINTIQSLDNLRLSTMGVQNDGILQKTQYKNKLQQQQSSASTAGVMRDGIKNREKFCAIANSIWGLNMFVGQDLTEEEIRNMGEQEVSATEGYEDDIQG